MTVAAASYHAPRSARNAHEAAEDAIEAEEYPTEASVSHARMLVARALGTPAASITDLLWRIGHLAETLAREGSSDFALHLTTVIARDLEALTSPARAA